MTHQLRFVCLHYSISVLILKILTWIIMNSPQREMPYAFMMLFGGLVDWPGSIFPWTVSLSVLIGYANSWAYKQSENRKPNKRFTIPFYEWKLKLDKDSERHRQCFRFFSFCNISSQRSIFLFAIVPYNNRLAAWSVGQSISCSTYVGYNLSTFKKTIEMTKLHMRPNILAYI